VKGGKGSFQFSVVSFQSAGDGGRSFQSSVGSFQLSDLSGCNYAQLSTLRARSGEIRFRASGEEKGGEPGGGGGLGGGQPERARSAASGGEQTGGKRLVSCFYGRERLQGVGVVVGHQGVIFAAEPHIGKKFWVTLLSRSQCHEARGE
jgi:hypothetical protein